jgi:asparagine synthase (glutamine-hydrolysing)
MCGIAGYLASDHTAADHGQVARAMTNAIAHRGPDLGHYWQDDGVTLGFRRLAIVDLSPAGDQPMHSACGRYVIAFNGEIYNHRDLRAQLEAEGKAPAWRGHSDTEVLLAAISSWGLERTLKAANGMFAIALWDRRIRTLSLARDRFGEKPLYYGWLGNSFTFASELAALYQHPAWDGEISRASLKLFLLYGNVPAPHSIFENIRKLQPGMIATIPWADRAPGQAPMLRAYWSALEAAEEGLQNQLEISEQDAITGLEKLFGDAVAIRMQADVPLGAFLSGGFDSTAVVAMMQSRATQPIRTFTIGFRETGYDEALFARDVARHLGTEHTELYVSPQQALEVIPSLSTIYSEPFADSSQIPTYLVSQLARRSVTVALSGDGGDELFGGYYRHFFYKRLNMLRHLPLPARRKMAQALLAVSPGTWNSLYRAVRPKNKMVGDHLHKLARILSTDLGLDGYQLLVSSGLSAAFMMQDVEVVSPIAATPLPAGANLVQQMMYLDSTNYMPDDILTKVDRATMSVSLEGRMPFLDHRVMEYSWRLPHAYKVNGTIGKHIVRELVYRHVPRAMMDRPKAGFGIPLDSWLRGPLRSWGSDVLEPSRLRADGYLNADLVDDCWQQHLRGGRNLQAPLWHILMFQCWLDNYRSLNSGAAARTRQEVKIAL